MKKILGLDLGTNSIGWAVITADDNNEDKSFQLQGIEAAGSRIIPMDASIMGDFEKGNSVSQTKDRTGFRGTRRLRERCLLRRERLHRVLEVMGFLPRHYSNLLDHYGKILEGTEPKLAWCDRKFIFMESYKEMLEEFALRHPELIAEGKRIPYDWTIYYLRKKALTRPISKQELAWLLLNFNQKRGYFQLRGEDEGNDTKKQKVEFYELKVVGVEDSGDRKGKDIWYNVILENGWIYRRTSSQPLDWIGKTKEFIVTTDLNDDGTVKVDKDGKEKRSFRLPKEDDWTLMKKKTESIIDKSDMTVGENIYNALLNNPDQKINGKLIRVIERNYYRDELKRIVEKQTEFIPELKDRDLYVQCVEELYPSNDDYRNNIINRNFSYLLVDDILFYQRPLKSKKSAIADCSYEKRYDKDGKAYPIKCVPKSNPYFQEFRLLQFISNLRIIEKEHSEAGKIYYDYDATNMFLKDSSDYERLFEWLNDRKEIEQKTLLQDGLHIDKKSIHKYRWNYVEDKPYPCNKTRAAILAKLDKTEKDKLTTELERKIWHLLYSVKTKAEIDKVFSESNTGIYPELKNYFSVESIHKLSKVKFDEDDYASYSEKALKKLLPLMRTGRYWTYDAIEEQTKDRIGKIITGEYDESIKSRVREKAIRLTDESMFCGLPVWLACYIVYGRHSEASDIQKWESPSDIDRWLSNFKQHSLRNPIVEKVITETMRTVRDIWKQADTIDEIHIELGREMKHTAQERKKMTERITRNEEENMRIKVLLSEFLNPEFAIEGVRPYSPSQQDLLKIYEEEVLDNSEMPQDIQAIFSNLSNADSAKRPTRSEIIRYKLWLDQKYQSPYTGEMIPLARLFTSDYEIEHIIPQSRFFDDSFSNKVICESEINKLKDNKLGMEFITSHSGEKVELSKGRFVKVFTADEYRDFVSKHYSSNKSKMKRLLMDEIPDQFIERQMNDSRYISSFVKNILSNIVRVREENGQLEEQAISKNLIVCNGTITDRLKQDWGVNDVWNSIILPRFERMNQITNSNAFTTTSVQGHIIPTVPFDMQKGFSKKRIDHRHHAMDAIVIACASRDHINLLNNEAAKSKNKENRYALSYKLRKVETITVNGKERNVFKEFKKPWPTFNQDVRQALQEIIVSFKQNLRVINKTVNHYQHYVDGKKIIDKQSQGDSWAIRKSMHKDTVWGEVNLRFKKYVSLKDALKQNLLIVDKDIKAKVKELREQGSDVKAIVKYFADNADVWSDAASGKIEVYYYSADTKDRYFATRFLSDLITYFDKVVKYDDAVKKINAITDSGIRTILLNHLANNDNNPALAFSADGIDKMNSNIVALNGGKKHKPIRTVRRYEKADKFAIGQTGNKSKKFVEGDKGTNLFFTVFETTLANGEKKRKFFTIPLNQVIDCQKQSGKEWKGTLVQQMISNGDISNEDRLLFILSPNDLVYVPTKEEINNGVTNIDKKRVYKMISSGTIQCFFVLHSVASLIIDKSEYSTQNKMERAITGEMIKEVCIPLSVDRIGNYKLMQL